MPKKSTKPCTDEGKTTIDPIEMAKQMIDMMLKKERHHPRALYLVVILIRLQVIGRIG